MPIEHHEGGSTSITGESITFLQLVAQKGAVGLELKGIRMSRGPVLWKQLKTYYGIQGGKKEVYAWLCAKVEELRPLQEHVMPDGKRFVGGEEVQ